jgi:predicted amidohydrolase YtcJ
VRTSNPDIYRGNYRRALKLVIATIGGDMSHFADVIITNVKVFTADESNPHAEAVAVRGDRIVSVGSKAEVEEWRGRGTRVLDGQGNTLLPGFIDSHFHLLWGSIELADAQLQGVRTSNDLRGVLQAFAADNKTSPWVVGNGIKYGIISTRQELDIILPDRPVFIEAYDGHTGWANTRALEMTGVLQPGKEIGPNGIIVRDAAGLAIGELREGDAMNAVLDFVPKPGEARKRELLKLAMKQIAAAGVTSVHNMNGDREEMLTYAAMEDAGEMTLRVYVPYLVKPGTTEDMLDEAAAMAGIQGEYARGGAAKFFMDGVWESYTALNLDPYADDPDATGTGIWSLESFTQMAAACDKRGLQIFVHACGDGAVRRTLDGYEAVQMLNGERDSRHRVEHIEVIHPDDMPRFKQLGVIASMQPVHSPMTGQDADVWLARTGPQRWPLSFAWRDLKNAGATLALGSDWSVASYNPMLGIFSALNRQKWEPQNPDQRLTLEEALIGYTRDAAYAEFQEHQKGQLKEGYLADMVLLSEDIFKTRPEELNNVKPLFTIVAGKLVYEAG